METGGGGGGLTSWTKGCWLLWNASAKRNKSNQLGFGRVMFWLKSRIRPVCMAGQTGQSDFDMSPYFADSNPSRVRVIFGSGHN